MTVPGRVWVLLCAVLATLALRPAAAESFYVAGHGGVPLAVTTVGPTDGSEILFIHGLGMGAASFAPQLTSDLSDRYRMVAFDLRGHGMSGKPWGEASYSDPAIWADDVRRVMAATGLRRPIVVGWSYGTLVAADYIRAEGTGQVAGLVLVSALGGLVSPAAPSGPVDQALLARLTRSRELRSVPTLDAQLEAIGIVTPMLAANDAAAAWLTGARSLGLLVPPYAQGPLRAHPANNAELAERLGDTPLLVVRGIRDVGMQGISDARILAALPAARIEPFEQSGHAPFAEERAAFNRTLSRFVDAHWTAAK